MNKYIYILAGMIYFQAIFSLTLNGVSYCGMDGVTSCHIASDMHDEASDTVKSCCTTKVSKKETKSCCSSKVSSEPKEHKECGDDEDGDCECPCCYQSLSVVIACLTEYEVADEYPALVSRDNEFGIEELNPFEYKYKEYHPPKFNVLIKRS